MPFSSRNRVAITLAASLLGACSTAAPSLPTDTTGTNRTAEVALNDFSASDVRMTCTDIHAENTQLKNARAMATSAIEANRGNNQAAGYFGALFLLPAIGLKTNEEEKALLEKSQMRRDSLSKLAYLKGCPPID
ncbi:MAG: hypothetical protein AB7N54_15970 [Alphaproteobacteria bacterium]